MRVPVTLVEWLRVQLDEDERVAQAAHQPNFRWYSEDKGVVTVWDEDDQEYARWRPANSNADAWHIVRWDPARVLAEVKAKRAILDEAVYLGSDEIVQLLAQPYAGRDGWQAEWATE